MKWDEMESDDNTKCFVFAVMYDILLFFGICFFQFHLQPWAVGLFFFISGGLYAASSPVFGHITDKWVRYVLRN